MSECQDLSEVMTIIYKLAQLPITVIFKLSTSRKHRHLNERFLYAKCLVEKQCYLCKIKTDIGMLAGYQFWGASWVSIGRRIGVSCDLRERECSAKLKVGESHC